MEPDGSVGIVPVIEPVLLFFFAGREAGFFEVDTCGGSGIAGYIGF